jgi:ribosomal-protein-alanine N-acetyltransferase
VSAIITSGGVEDLPAIMPVMTSAFPAQFGEAWSAAQCMGALVMPGAKLFVARNGAVQGFALFRTVAHETELMLLAVSPPARRNGLGRRLLDAVAEDARKDGSSAIHLEVRSSNPAIALYSSAGFANVGRRLRYYRGTDGSTHDAVTYRLSLT